MIRWIPFAILALVTVVVQTTLAPAVAIGFARPDWMFVLAVHYALWGRWPDAAVAAWILGLLVDLHSADLAGGSTVGLHAFLYGLAACMILRVRQALFRDNFVTQIVITFVFALFVQLAAGSFYLWRAPASGMPGGLRLLAAALAAAAYTSIWAPYIHWPLIRLQRWTGLHTRRDFSMDTL